MKTDLAINTAQNASVNLSPAAAGTSNEPDASARSTDSPATAPNLGYRRSFAIILTSVVLLSFGGKLYEIILPLMMYDITHSSVAMSSMKTAELLPNFFFAIFIGVLVDRVNKKRWILWMIGLQAMLLLAFAVLFRSGIHLLPVYYAIGFLLMTLNYGYFNAEVSLIKLSVPVRELTSANAKLSFAETFVGIMGPALSGLILMLSDISDGLLITSFCYLICMGLFTRLKLAEKQETPRQSRFAAEFLEGWRAFCVNKPLVLMTVFVVFLNCTYTVISTTSIYYAKDDLGLSSSLLAVVLSASGAGGLAGSLLLSRLRQSWGLGKVFGASILLNVIAYLLLFLIDGLVMFAVALFLSGFAATLYSVSVYAFRQEQTPAPLMGRIAGITGTCFRIGMPIAVYASGWVIAWWGTSVIFITCAIWNLIVLAFYVRTRLWNVQ
ncbi:Na+/melibiose symporter [Paenibacillus barengoltzii]|uniref:MFS transporter n=1 Tax=Paenibacillus barengoltzii TaxID=343517 RepID=UPI000A08C7E3|nr:MFS transporter [Paenibacillus barengoltzii]SMF31204.1 Na+/melibiose symporter [Paenibacillus barengoltzii]